MIWDYMKFWFAKDIAEFVGMLIVMSLVGLFFGAWCLRDYLRSKRGSK